MQDNYKSILKTLLLGVLIMGLNGCGWMRSTFSTNHPSYSEKRETEYLQANSIDKISKPSGVTLAKANDDFNVPNGSQRPLTMVIPSPPGSNLGQTISPTNKSVMLALVDQKPTQYGFYYRHLLTSHPRIQVNQDFENTWNALALALAAGNYHVVGESWNNGNMIVESKVAGASMRYLLHVDIHGDASQMKSDISVLDEQSKPLQSTEKANNILTGVYKRLGAVTKLPHDFTSKPITAFTSNAKANPIMIINRGMNWSWSNVGQALREAGFHVVKVFPEKHVYYVVDTSKTDGKLKAHLPIYAVFIRSNGAISKVLVLDEHHTFAPPKTAGRILERVKAHLKKGK